jgi:hypothetical protein
VKRLLKRCSNRKGARVGVGYFGLAPGERNSSRPRISATRFPACRAAAEAAPDEPRFRYPLARALYRADEREEAAALIRATAEKGYPAAQNDLGFRYENGSGIAKDNAEALRQYRQAAQGGYAPAFSNVGRFYWAGIAVVANRAKARQWFERGLLCSRWRRSCRGAEDVLDLGVSGFDRPEGFETYCWIHREKGCDVSVVVVGSTQSAD